MSGGPLHTNRTDDPGGLKRWLLANAVVASLFAVALGLMAVFAAHAPGPAVTAGHDDVPTGIEYAANDRPDQALPDGNVVGSVPSLLHTDGLGTASAN